MVTGIFGFLNFKNFIIKSKCYNIFFSPKKEVTYSVFPFGGTLCGWMCERQRETDRLTCIYKDRPKCLKN